MCRANLQGKITRIYDFFVKILGRIRIYLYFCIKTNDYTWLIH